MLILLLLPYLKGIREYLKYLLVIKILSLY